MASGTLASLAIAVGLDDRALTSGLSRMNSNVLSTFSSLGKRAESQMASSVNNIQRQTASLGASIAKPMLIGAAAVVAVGASLAALAIQFESETSHIAAAANISAENARKVGEDYLRAAGSSQQMIFTAKDMTESYAKVAGQLALADSKVAVYTQDMTFMRAAVNLAAGANTTLGSASDAVASIIQNFQLKVKDSAQASDILFDASRGLNMSLSETADTAEKLRGRLGTAGLGLKDTATLMEIMATHSLTGQRNIILFTGAINNLLGTAADPTKLATAQNALSKAQDASSAAQLRYNAALGKVGVPAATHLMDLQKLQDAYSRYVYNLGKYGAATVQTQSALVAYEAAQQRVTNESTKGSAAVSSAQAALVKSHEAVAAAQTKVATMSGYNNATLKALGVTVYDAQGNFIGMRNVIGQLHTAFAKLNPEQQQFYATQLFGKTPASAMIGIIQGGVATWDKYAANIGRAGSASQGALAATDNIAASWDRFKARLAAAATTISLEVEPVFRGLMKTGTDLVGPLTTGFTTFFNIAKTGVGDVINVLSTIQHFVPLLQIIGVLVGLWVLRWTALKALHMAADISGLAASLIRLTASGGPLTLFKNMIGAGEHGSITGNVSYFKNQWADAFQSRNLSNLTTSTTAVEKLTGDLANLSERAGAIQAFKAIHPEVDVSAVESSLAKMQGEITSRLENALQTSFNQGAKYLTGSLEAGTTAARVAPILSAKYADAGAMLKSQLEKGAAGAVPAISSDIEKGIKQGVPSSQELISRITGKGGAGEAIASDVAKGAGILGRAGGVLSKVSGLALTAQAQPVFVVNWPGGFGPGFPTPGSLKNVLKGGTAAEAGRLAAADVERGTANALAKDAVGTAATTSISSKILGGLKALLPGGVTAATSVIAAVAPEVAGPVAIAAAPEIAAASAPLAVAAAPIIAGAIVATSAVTTVLAAFGKGPLAGRGIFATPAAQPTVREQQRTDEQTFNRNYLRKLGLRTNLITDITNFESANYGKYKINFSNVLSSSEFQKLSAQQQKDAMASLALNIENHNVTTQRQAVDWVSAWTRIVENSRGMEPTSSELAATINLLNNKVGDAAYQLGNVDLPGIVSSAGKANVVATGLPAAITNFINTLPKPAAVTPINVTSTFDQINKELAQAPADVKNAINQVTQAFAKPPAAKSPWDAMFSTFQATLPSPETLANEIIANGVPKTSFWNVYNSNLTTTLPTASWLAQQIITNATPKDPISLWTTLIGASNQAINIPTLTTQLATNLQVARDYAAALDQQLGLSLLTRPPAGGGTPSAPVGHVGLGGTIPFQGGGWITEPIIGYGVRSGTKYTLGEHEDELVTPRSSINAAKVRGFSGVMPTTPVSGKTTTIEHLDVHNPIPEPAAESVDRRLRRLSYTGLG